MVQEKEVERRKVIKVVAAIICDSISNKHKIFATSRGYGEWKGFWEFPGGKVEENETSQNALKREIKEELNVEVVVDKLLETVEYDYPEFHLSMECYWCEIEEGNLTLLEADEGRWLLGKDLYSVEWLPADIKILHKIEKNLN